MQLESSVSLEWWDASNGKEVSYRSLHEAATHGLLLLARCTADWSCACLGCYLLLITVTWSELPGYQSPIRTELHVSIGNRDSASNV